MEQHFGFIKDEMELKVLILYILRRMTEPVPYINLLETVLSCDDNINYFDFCECLSSLVSTDHISVENGFYTCTSKGIDNGEASESIIPYSVRLEADNKVAELSHMLKRYSIINATHVMHRRGDFTVNLSMSDGIGPVLNIQMLCSDKEQVKLIEDNFRRNAESLYIEIANLLLNEKN